MTIVFEDFQKNVFLKKYTTLGVGGPARFFIEVHDVISMQEVMVICKKESLPYFILGKGSNVFFDDLGFPGVVILNRISHLQRPKEHVWHVGAGYSFSLLGSQTAREGWSGLEFAAGIPGSVGGAIYMNAGANKNETARFLESTDFVNAEGELLHFTKENLSFSYRTSSFQKMKGAIVGGTFHLVSSHDSRPTQLEMIQYRKKTQPYECKSAGCFFRNLPSHPAGLLIEQCGLKGKSIGGAQVSPLHANFLINSNQATCHDVLALMQYVQEEVKKKTGHELEREVIFVPYSIEENNRD